MNELLGFLRELRDHNEREWYHAHRTEWKRVDAQFQAFVGELIEGIASFDSSIRGLTVKECTYRLARDTRFSPDKTPYKTHVGAYIAPHGKKAGYAGYYFHVEPKGEGMLGGCMLTAGIYCPEPMVLRSVRDEILDNGAQIVNAMGEAPGFSLADHRLKRTPRGFPAGSEFDDMLRLKDVYLEKSVSEEFMCAPDLLDKTLAEFRRTHRFVEILNRAVQYAYEEMM